MEIKWKGIIGIEYIVFSSLVWCTFNEGFSLFNIATGALLGRLFLVMSKKFLNEKESDEGNHKKFSLTLYFIRLMADLYINTVDLIHLILTDDLDPTLVKVRSKGRGRVGSLIANSITLTPKTSCIDKEGDMLTVLCAHEMTRGEIIDALEIRTLREDALIPNAEFIKGG